jgi:hypothetical protein
MNIDEILKQYDPAQESGGADLAALREAIINARPRPRQTMRRAVIACALLLVLITIAVVVAPHSEPPQHPAPIVRSAPLRQPETRQLQLTTPGGTRLVWVFNDSM